MKDPDDFARFTAFAVENLSDATYWMTEDSRIIYVNAAATEMLGYSREELLQLRVYELNPTLSAESWRKLWQALSEQGRRVFETQHRAKDGRIVPVEVAANYLEFGGKAYSVAFTRDISERKQLELRLRQGEKMEAIGQLAGGVAHDFNNQLAGIMGYAELLSFTTQGDERAQDLLDNIKRAVERAADLTGQLLAFSRPEKFVRRPTDVHELISDVVSMLSRSIDKTVRVEKHFTEGGCWSLGHASLLQNAILNLALNARDAMPSGGTLRFSTQHLELDVASAQRKSLELPAGAYVVVSVEDSGAGMDERTKQRVFEPFFTTKGVGEGTGLGLAAVYSTVKNHGGAIVIESEPGKGTRVDVYLPASEPKHKSVPTSDARLLQDIRPHVLVVEDEESLRRITTEQLESFGCRVAAFENGKLALSYFVDHASEVDLVVLDMVMPVMGGRDTFEAMKALRADVRVLLASGYSLDGDARRLLDAGAFGHLQKPYSSQELYGRVIEALEGRHVDRVAG